MSVRIFACLFLSIVLAACGQMDGEVCQVHGDCAPDLICCKQDTDPATRGICRTEAACTVAMTPDAQPVDASGEDAGSEDAGGEDASAVDSDAGDSGSADATVDAPMSIDSGTDAGESDAGSDAGETDAGLDSST